MQRLHKTRALGYATAFVLVAASIGHVFESVLVTLGFVSPEQLPSWALSGFGLMAGALLKTVGSFVLLPLWCALSYANVQRLGAVGLRYTPSQVAIGFYVPFLNMVRPWFALKDLWSTSDPALAQRGRYDGTGWLGTEGSPLLTLFWAAFVTTWLVTFVPVWPVKGILGPVANAVMAATLVFLVVAIERRFAALRTSLEGGPSLAAGLGHVAQKW